MLKNKIKSLIDKIDSGTISLQEVKLELIKMIPEEYGNVTKPSVDNIPSLTRRCPHCLSDALYLQYSASDTFNDGILGRVSVQQRAKSTECYKCASCGKMVYFNN